MATDTPPVKLNTGEVVKGFVVKKKLGEGACGTVYLVQNQKDEKVKGAMKVEPKMKSADDEILKMEVFVLRRCQASKHVCKLFVSGKQPTFSFVVMSLLGKELSDLRRRIPDRKFSPQSTLKVGFQCTQALQDMHVAGFIHRDVKPTNFACGLVNPHIIYLFDFGLARQILIADKSGKQKLRDPRTKVCFRGTVRYCSPNVHNYKEQGRHDDLISMMYMLIELATSSLPWKGMMRREAGHLKETIPDATLVKGCPPGFMEIQTTLKKLTYHDAPAYEHFRDLFKRDLGKNKLTEPFEWEVTDKSLPKQIKKHVKKNDERAEIERSEDDDTVKDLDESVLTGGEDPDSEMSHMAKEDTLDNVASMAVP